MPSMPQAKAGGRRDGGIAHRIRRPAQGLHRSHRLEHASPGEPGRHGVRSDRRAAPDGAEPAAGSAEPTAGLDRPGLVWARQANPTTADPAGDPATAPRAKMLWGWAAAALVILLVVQNRSTG